MARTEIPIDLELNGIVRAIGNPYSLREGIAECSFNHKGKKVGFSITRNVSTPNITIEFEGKQFVVVDIKKICELLMEKLDEIPDAEQR